MFSMCIIKSNDHLSSKQKKKNKKKKQKQQQKKKQEILTSSKASICRERQIKKKWQTNVEQFRSGHPRGGFSENSKEVDSIIVKAPWQP